MSTVIRFLPDLAQWVTQRLDQGQAPDTLVAPMVGEKMQPEVANAIVGAFLHARKNGHPPPVDAVIVEGEIAAQAPAGSLLPPGLGVRPAVGADRAGSGV